MSSDKQPQLPYGNILTADSSLQAAFGGFEKHMQDEGFSLNTQKAFNSDIRLLGRYLGIGQAVGDISTSNLNDFLAWLRYERGVPCSVKSYARRVTTLKVFFGWLHKIEVLLEDPAAKVIQSSVTSPLPTVPSEEHLAKATVVGENWRLGVGLAKPDARPGLLLWLLLQTGIKKGEAMAIVPNHIDRSNPDNPFLFVRYKNPQLRYKERKIPLEPLWLVWLDEYKEQYRPDDTLFTCTARNLEYVLDEIGKGAGFGRGVLSFESLRWASAMRDFRAGVEETALRERLGLSKITWRETKSKLEKLLAQEKRAK